jgi:hypothetical protein
VHERFIVELYDPILVSVKPFERVGELLDVHTSTDELVKVDSRGTSTGIRHSCLG